MTTETEPRFQRYAPPPKKLTAVADPPPPENDDDGDDDKGCCGCLSCLLWVILFLACLVAIKFLWMLLWT